jgi:hypothetical protein
MLVHIPLDVAVPSTDAASLFPSALEAIKLHLAPPVGNPEVRSSHVEPELLLVHIPPSVTTAASFVPSELEAIEFHFADDGADVLLQEKPVPLAVALLPSPDLSLQVVINAPLVAGIPVAFGSAASSHRTHPGTKKVVEFIVFSIPDRSAHDVTPAAVDEMVVVAWASSHNDNPGRRGGKNLSWFNTLAIAILVDLCYVSPSKFTQFTSHS